MRNKLQWATGNMLPKLKKKSFKTGKKNEKKKLKGREKKGRVMEK